jgi:hypothetical protein
MSNEELNEPTSIMEFSVAQQNNTKVISTFHPLKGRLFFLLELVVVLYKIISHESQDTEGKIIRFEMNKEQLLAMLHQVNSIQKVIDEVAQK